MNNQRQICNFHNQCQHRADYTMYLLKMTTLWFEFYSELPRSSRHYVLNSAIIGRTVRSPGTRMNITVLKS